MNTGNLNSGAVPNSGASPRLPEGVAQISNLPYRTCPTCPPFEPRRRSAAFTLLELLVVISIIGLLAALAVPVLNNFKPNYTANATQALMGDLSRARQLASKLKAMAAGGRVRSIARP